MMAGADTGQPESLFDEAEEAAASAAAPLAVRMRPRTLDEVIGGLVVEGDRAVESALVSDRPVDDLPHVVVGQRLQGEQQRSGQQR